MNVQDRFESDVEEAMPYLKDQMVTCVREFNDEFLAAAFDEGVRCRTDGVCFPVGSVLECYIYGS